jgi:hypothetical protein
VSAFAQAEVAIFAIVKWQPGTLNTQRHFDRSKHNEHLYIIGVAVVVAGYLGVHV